MCEGPYAELVAACPDTPIAALEVFCHTVWLESSGVGLASTVGAKRETAALDLAPLRAATAAQLASRLGSGSALESAIALAAINSTLDPRALDPARFGSSSEKAFDRVIAAADGRRVSVVGRFPSVERLAQAPGIGDLRVFELDPRGEGELGPDRYGEFLPRSDIIVVTATTLANGSFHRLRPHFPDRAEVLLVGPSTPFSPILFDHGVHVLCGAVVADRDLAKQSFAAGATYRRNPGLEFLTVTRLSQR